MKTEVNPLKSWKYFSWTAGPLFKPLKISHQFHQSSRFSHKFQALDSYIMCFCIPAIGGSLCSVWGTQPKRCCRWEHPGWSWGYKPHDLPAEHRNFRCLGKAQRKKNSQGRCGWMWFWYDTCMIFLRKLVEGMPFWILFFCRMCGLGR